MGGSRRIGCAQSERESGAHNSAYRNILGRKQWEEFMTENSVENFEASFFSDLNRYRN